MTDLTEYAHDVCFLCRKAWAPMIVKERRHERTLFRMRNSRRPCPDCGKPLVGLGLAFRPPKQRASRAWCKVEAAARAGNKFFKP